MAEELEQNQQPDTGPQQIQRPAQFPTATRIENGTAYDMSGKALGSVDVPGQAAEEKDDDFFTKLGGQPVQAKQEPAQEQVVGDDFFAKLGGQVVQAPAAQPSSQFAGGTIQSEDRGAWAGLKRDTIGMVEGMYHAFTDEATPQEKAEIAQKMNQMRAGQGMPAYSTLPAIPGEYLGIATNTYDAKGTRSPSRAQLALHRLIDAPGEALHAKANKELDAARDLWDNKERWKGANLSVSGATDKVLSNIPLIGPMINSIAERLEQGDTSGAMVDIGTLIALEKAPKALKELVTTDKAALEAASKIHGASEKVHTQRLQELGTATKQAEAATKAAMDARTAEEAGTGSRQQTIDAENTASEAAKNAKTAQAAIRESGEARAQAGMERDRLQRKVQKSINKVNEKQIQAQRGAKEDFQRVAPPAEKGPAAYNDRDYEVARRYLEDHHENVEQIRSKQEAYDALNRIQQGMEEKVKPYVEKYSADPIQSNVRMDVRDALADHPRSDFAERGMAELDKYGITDDRDLTVGEADDIRARLNSANRETMARYMPGTIDFATVMDTNPEFAARYAALDSLRDGIYNTFEDRGVKGIRELRQDEASVIKVRAAAGRGLTKGGTRVRGTGESGPLRKTAAWAAQKGATMLGAKVGGPWGAAAAETTHPYLGRLIAPGDLTQDQLVQRSFKVKGGGVPMTEIEGPGRPSQPMSPRQGPAMSPRDILQIQREYGPLHSELSTHYAEPVGNSTYADLEQRFKDDIADKQRHGVTLESSEKNLLSKINQQDAADTLKTQAEAQQQALSGKTIGKVNLPEDVEPVMHIQGDKMPNGMTTPEGLVHDLAHIVVGSERGIKFPDGIRSHFHPENGGGRLMSAPLDWDEFHDAEGNIDFNKVKGRMADLATTYVAGGVANDLYHDVPFTENHGLGADMKVLKKFLKSTGFSELEASKMIAQAADDAAEILSRPGTREILEGHAMAREAGLDKKYHFSPERVEQVLQDIKEGTKRETTNGKSTGVPGAGNAGTEQPGKGPEGQGKGRNNEGVREESKGRAEGKEAVVGKQPERTATPATGKSGPTEPNNPALSTVGQGGHAGGGVASEEELARPGRFVKINRAGIPTDQGKVPDFNLAAGEAGYQVKPGGAYELKAGQETPATKRGVEGYAREVYGSNNPALPERLPKVENLRVPPERTTGEYDDAIKEGGAVPGGIQKGDPEIDIPDLALFHDPTTGSTLALPTDKVTPENVRANLKKSRDMYIAAEDKKAAAAKLNPALSKEEPSQLNKWLEEKSGYHPDLQAVVKDLGSLTRDPSIVKHTGAFIAPDGQFIGLRPGEQHPELITRVTGAGTFEGGDNRKGFVDQTGAIRTRHIASRGAEALHVSVPSQGVTPEQITALRQAAGQLRNGDMVMERSDISPETKDLLSTKKEFISPNDIEPMLRQIGAHPESGNWMQKAADTSGDGFSYHPKTGAAPTDGYMVETELNRGQQYDHPPTAEDIRAYVEKNKDFLDKNPDLYVGGYKNTLGLSKRFTDQAAAEELGKKTNQISIYDVAGKKEIPTGGTGEVESLNPALSSPKGSSVPLMENPLPVKGTMKEGEIGTLDLTKALNKFSRKQLPALEPGSEPKEMVDRAKKIAADEAKYQLAQSKTGTEWYTTEMKDHDKVLQGLRPELAQGETTDAVPGHPVNLTLFKAAEAILSSGQKPYANVKSALKAWDAYKETGEFPRSNPAPGKEGMSWGPRQANSYGNAFDNLNRLIAEKGPKGAADWLLDEHPVSELKEYKQEVGGKKGDIEPGAKILGEKRGPFMQNLHGIESKFTADMWVSRTWNRWMGTLDTDPRIEEKGKMTSESDAPRNNTERKLMKESFEKTANKLGLTTSSLQAVLWYYEQALYRAHGLPVESWSFSDAAKRVAKEASAVPEAEQTGFNFGENVEPGVAGLRTEPKNPNAVTAIDFLNKLRKK